MAEYNIIKQGNKIPISWNSNDVFRANMYLTKNPYDPTSKKHVIYNNLPSENNENTYVWIVSDDDVTVMGEIDDIYLVISMIDNSEILDVSLPFKLVKKGE